MKTVLILATLDTKLEEANYLKQCVEDNGCETILLDCSLTSVAPNQNYTSRKEMLDIAGVTEEVLADCDKRTAHSVMEKMTKMYTTKKLAENKIHGAIGIGGVQGTLIAANALKELRVGFPKMLLSTVANGKATFEPLVGISDMVIMHSVADIAGLNPLLKEVIHNAAAAISGMAKSEFVNDSHKRCIGITMGGVTTVCVNRILQQLRNDGYDAIIFHCNGIGAKTMEELVKEKKISAVMDITPHDVMDLLQSGLMPASEDRYKKLEDAKIPVLIAPGCADIILFNGLENVPEKFKQRKFYEHNAIHTHVKANYEEMYQLGSFIASKFSNAADDTVSVMIPKRGYSQKNFPEGPLYDAVADKGFEDALGNRENKRINVKSFDLHINDADFADACVEEIKRLMESRR